MTEPRWLRHDIVIAIHEAQLDEHGGASGVRDAGMLLSALDRPKNTFHYEQADVIACAAAYAYGLAQNHAFVDGNKRTALLACLLFLGLNGFKITAQESQILVAVIKLSAGEWSENEFEIWLRDSVQST